MDQRNPADVNSSTSSPTIADPALPLVWVVEDNPTDLFFLQHRLQRAGCECPLVHAEDGLEAIRMLGRCLGDQPDAPLLPTLMFLDLKMPRVDGFEVLSWLGERQLFDRITVVVVSTSDEPEDVARVHRLGAHRFLVKYPRPGVLAEVVALAAQRARGEVDSVEACSSGTN